jgi:hypothetical protein
VAGDRPCGVDGDEPRVLTIDNEQALRPHASQLLLGDVVISWEQGPDLKFALFWWIECLIRPQHDAVRTAGTV